LRALRELACRAPLLGRGGARRRGGRAHRPLRHHGESALQWSAALPLCQHRAQGSCEQQQKRPPHPRHFVTVRVAEPLLPVIVAVMVAVELEETLFPFTIAVAALFAPVDVVLLDGVTVAAPVAFHETVRPWRRL
jgi:hypothetical protein